jgi:hypothetical protein
VRRTDRTAGLTISSVIVGGCILLVGAAITDVSTPRSQH